MAAFLIPAAIAGISALASAAPSLIRTKQEKANAKRRKELEAMEGHLGLTPEERAQLEGQFADRIEGTQRAGERQASDALANVVGGGSGDALKRAGQARTETQGAHRDAVGIINQANSARRSELEQELEDRRAFSAQAGRDRAAAATSVVGATVTGGAMGVEQQKMLGRLGGEAGMAASRAAQLGGLTQEQLKKVAASLRARGLDAAEVEALIVDEPPPKPAAVPDLGWVNRSGG